MRATRLLIAGVLSAATVLTVPVAVPLPAHAEALPLCEDGIDDDRDGLTDYPADPGCTSADDPNERGDLPCDNTRDDDNDGIADAPLDPGCSGPTDPDERRGTVCDDGVDNDGDGFADHPLDTGCASGTDATETPDCAESAPGVVVCATPGAVVVEPVVPYVTVTPGDAHRIRGYVDAYEFVVPGAGTYTLPCVVLSSSVTGNHNPCADFGGRFEQRRFTLVEADPREPAVATSGELARVRVCHATVRVTVFGFGPETLPGLVLC